MFEEFAMGSMGPDNEDASNVYPGPGFIPKQVSPEDQEKQIVDSIAGARRLSNMFDVMENEVKLSYLVDVLLPDSGLMYIAGISGSGKTILAMQLLVSILFNEPCMTWRMGDAISEDIKVLMFSLEMNDLELAERGRHMFSCLSDDQKKSFKERFITYSEPEPFKLWEPAHQLEFIRTVKASGASVQLIDSASVSFGEELTNQAQVNKTLDFLRMIRAKYNWAQIIVAHTRKPDRTIASAPEEATLNELFGHSGVAQSASSIIVMMEDEPQRKDVIKRGLDQKEIEKKVHIINAKVRFGANGGAFVAHLTSKNDVDAGQPLMFKRNAIPIAMTDSQKQKARSKKDNSINEALATIDLGSLLGDDDG
jgi:hypothetical protein